MRRDGIRHRVEKRHRSGSTRSGSTLPPPPSSASNGLRSTLAIIHTALMLRVLAVRVVLRRRSSVSSWSIRVCRRRALRRAALVMHTHRRHGAVFNTRNRLVHGDLSPLLLSLHFRHDPIATHSQVEALHDAAFFALFARRYCYFACVVVRAAE